MISFIILECVQLFKKGEMPFLKDMLPGVIAKQHGRAESREGTLSRVFFNKFERYRQRGFRSVAALRCKLEMSPQIF